IARRKKLYEKFHPETKKGKAPGAGRGKRKRPEESQNETFVSDAAKKTRRGRSTIARDVTRVNKVGVLPDIVGTSLDQGDELDALAKRPPDEQRKLAEQAKSGAKVSAKTTPTPAPGAHDDIDPDSASEVEELRRRPPSAKEMTALIGQVVAGLWKWSKADERKRHKIIKILEHAGRLIEQLARDSES